ncbi:MAG: RDD family protein [Vicinamibacteria bacterium]
MSTRVLSDQTFLEIPENVRLGFRLAGPGTRLGAYLLDLACRGAVLYAIVAVLSFALLPFAASGLHLGVYLVVAFLLEWGYGCFFETWWNGQTPGKRAFGLRVIKTEGYAIGFYEAMIRNLLRAADFAPLFYAAGFLTSMTNPRLQRIGDLVAGTMVVRERRPELGGELQGLTDYEPFPPEAFRHRYRPSERTLEVIEGLFRRRFELPPARLDEIGLVLAEPLGKRLDSFPDRKFAREQPAEFLFRLLATYRARPEDDLEWERDPSERPEPRSRRRGVSRRLASIS